MIADAASEPERAVQGINPNSLASSNRDLITTTMPGERGKNIDFFVLAIP